MFGEDEVVGGMHRVGGVQTSGFFLRSYANICRKNFTVRAAILYTQCQLWIQVFPRGGSADPPILRGGGTYDFANFFQNCMKLKELDPVPHALLRSATGMWMDLKRLPNIITLLLYLIPVFLLLEQVRIQGVPGDRVLPLDPRFWGPKIEHFRSLFNFFHIFFASLCSSYYFFNISFFIFIKFKTFPQIAPFAQATLLCYVGNFRP